MDLKPKRKIHHLILISFLASLLLIMNMALVSCSQDRSQVILATTTSTYDSGLLDALLPEFEKQSNFKVKPIAVGTGEALAMGRRGEADVLLVHSEEAEEEFVSEGYGLYRKAVMHNDFVLVGPKNDPADIKGEPCTSAFIKIRDGKSLFVSRADGSGTNQKEKMIWEETGIKPAGNWYIESGQGMGSTLRITDEKRAYTLTDRGTYLSLKESLSLVVLVEGGDILFNPYGIIPVNPETFPDLDINIEGAEAFVNFIRGPEGQEIIRNYGTEKYGQPLFYPDVIN